MTADDDFDAAWDKVTGEDDADAGEGAGDGGEVVDVGPPIRVTVVVKSEKIPVAPWPEGWRVGAAGPMDGHVSLLFEHDLDDSPVLQLAAVTGLLKTLQNSKLDMAWWAVQTRGPIPDEALEGMG